MSTRVNVKAEIKPTFCYQCNAGPDLLNVRCENGVAVGIEPRFDAVGVHPADGRVCVKAYGLIQKAYNPHRVTQPMKRTNPNKGRGQDPGFVPISWDEALDTLAAKLRAIRETGFFDASGHARVASSIGEAGVPVQHMGSLAAFLVAFGPMDAGFGAGQGIQCYHSEHFYGELWHRSYTVSADALHVNFVLSMGSNTDASGGVTGAWRNAEARGRGAKRVQVEPHLSVTGASATEWVPVRPKTDAAFMYALLHVLLFEHATDELDVDFLRRRTASAYLVGPNGYYLRDAQTRAPLVWDAPGARAVPQHESGIVAALEGPFHASGIEIGPDGVVWHHEQAEVRTGFDRAKAMLSHCTPEWAQAICDVPAATMRRIASEMLTAATIGATIEIEGRTLPLRPVAVVLGKTVNNGWGGYQCVWARTMLACVLGAMEVPGGTVGTAARMNRPNKTRHAAVVPGEDGFMSQALNPTEAEAYKMRPKSRNAYNVLVPLSLDSSWSPALGPAHLPWLFQQQPPEGLPKPTLPEVWIVYRTNPAISSWDASFVADRIAEFPFTVAFAYTRDESNHMADLLLPDAMDLESTQLIRVGGTKFMDQYWLHEGFALRQPVVDPAGEVRDMSDIATELARRVGVLTEYNRAINGGLLGVRLKGQGYDFSLREDAPHGVEEIWDAVCRAASWEVTDGQTTDGLDWYKAHGYRVKPFSKLEWYLYPALEERNLRIEFPYQERLLRVGHQLKARLHEHGIRWWDTQLAEYEAIPEWSDFPALWERAVVAKGRKPEEFPFWLVASRSMQYAWGSTVGLQIMDEVARNLSGHAGLIINADRAAALGIAEGDLVEISTPSAATRGRASLRQGIRPDTILAIGQFGHWATPYAKDMNTPRMNDLTPISLELTDATGSAASLVRVALRRA